MTTASTLLIILTVIFTNVANGELIGLIQQKDWPAVLLHIDAHPGDVEDESSGEWFPLHKACFYKAPLEVITALIETYPDELRSTSRNGNVPLHDLFYLTDETGPPDNSVIRKMISEYPGAAYVKNEWRKLPLHVATRYGKGVTQTSFTLLIEANPDAINARDNNGYSPVDYAMENDNVKPQFLRSAEAIGLL